MQNVSCWLHAANGVSAPRQDDLTKSLAKRGVKVEPRHSGALTHFGVCTFGINTPELRDFLRHATKGGEHRVIAVADPCGSYDGRGCWDLLQAGASDILVIPDHDQVAQEIRSRFERWQCVDQLLEEASISDLFVAKSHLSRAIVRDIVDIARFSTANVLVLGETGTGKEIVAQAHTFGRPATGQARLSDSGLFYGNAGAFGQRVLRSRAGRLHGRDRGAARSLRIGEWRNVVPGRDRRTSPDATGAIASRGSRGHL